MKYILSIAAFIMLSAFSFPGVNSIHSFKVKSIEGKSIDFSSFKGKKILVVNTASKCGYTPQYDALQKVYNQYKDAKFNSGKGFTVYSYSLDQNKDRWVAAIAQDQLAWPNHTSDLKGWNAEGAGVYGVRSIPMTYLLDGEGKIIAKGLRGPALEEKLKSMLK